MVFGLEKQYPEDESPYPYSKKSTWPREIEFSEKKFYLESAGEKVLLYPAFYLDKLLHGEDWEKETAAVRM